MSDRRSKPLYDMINDLLIAGDSRHVPSPQVFQFGVGEHLPVPLDILEGIGDRQPGAAVVEAFDLDNAADLSG